MEELDQRNFIRKVIASDVDDRQAQRYRLHDRAVSWFRHDQVGGSEDCLEREGKDGQGVDTGNGSWRNAVD
jgi:hypothetical protein